MLIDCKKICAQLEQHIDGLDVIQRAEHCCQSVINDFKNDETCKINLKEAVGNEFTIEDVIYRFISCNLRFTNTDGYTFPTFCTTFALEAFDIKVGWFSYYVNEQGEYLDESFHIFGYTK